MKYDFIVVGAGFYGCTFARAVAEKGARVLVIEKNGYIGGLSHTYFIDKVQVHSYGPHILHTDSDRVWTFLKHFGTVNNFKYHPIACYKDKYYSFPVNKMTLQQANITPPLKGQTCENENFEEYLIRRMGKKIYTMFFYYYTKKMWGVEPRTLPASIAHRIPFRPATLNDQYYTHKYEGIAQDGYTKLMENMLDHKNIKIYYNDNFLENRWHYKKIAKNIIFTGTIDSYFNYEFGMLPYRTLDINYVGNKKWYYAVDALGANAVNYTDNRECTREICHNYWLPETINNCDKYVITTETPRSLTSPFDEGIPMYPMRNIGNSVEIYEKYRNLAKHLSNVHFKGRLGDYKYMDMCPTIEDALHFAEEFT